MPPTVKIERVPAKDMPASPKQKQLMNFIHYYWEAHGYGPTIAEMGIAVNRSPATARHHLVKLMEKDMIIHRIAQQRGWALNERGKKEIEPL